MSISDNLLIELKKRHASYTHFAEQYGFLIKLRNLSVDNVKDKASF